MDPITMQKLQAINKYRRTQFLHTLFQYLLTALVVGMCLSKVLWFPSSLFSSMKLFFTVSIPNIGAFIVNPKCLFVVCNVIVIFLVCESKLTGPSSSSSDIYDDFARHSQSLRRKSSMEKKEMEKSLEVNEEVIKKVVEEEQKEREEGEKEEVEEEEEEEKTEKGREELEEGEEEEEEENRIDADELKKRFEDFIARVNNQRRLEAKLFVCSDLKEGREKNS